MSTILSKHAYQKIQFVKMVNEYLMSKTQQAYRTHVRLAVAFSAEYRRRLEERDATIAQLQRLKVGACQNVEDMKKQLEEESKVILNS